MIIKYSFIFGKRTRGVLPSLVCCFEVIENCSEMLRTLDLCISQLYAELFKICDNLVDNFLNLV